VDSETAKLILAGITALAVVVWLTGFQFLVSSARKGQPETSIGDEGFEDSGSSKRNLVAGAAEVEGQADVLAARAASLLARGGLFPLVPLKIVEKSENHVRFERVEPGGEVRSGGGWLRQGQLSFVSLGGGRSRVEWAVELANMQWLLRLGALFQVAGLIAIIAGFWAILSYVVPSPDPSIRWQTVQMLQVSHLIWPPFLFGALYRRGRRDMAARLQALAHNLPYLGDETP
jgi:hypothetical protein